MILDWHRTLSLALAVFYVGAAYWIGGGEIACKTLAFVILPLTCVWFSEAMGNYTGMMGSMPINQESPGVIVRLLGWVLLFLPIVFAAYEVFYHGKP